MRQGLSWGEIEKWDTIGKTGDEMVALWNTENITEIIM
jgi:hypothetical protein